MNIVVLDGYGMNPGDMSWDSLSQLGTLTVYDRTAPADIIPRVLHAEVVLTNKVVLSADMLAQLPALKYVGVLATGYNVVDTAAARQHGIIVTNIPAYSTESVVQMVFAHLLNITNQIGHFATENAAGRWSRNADFCYWDTPLHELAGKRIGIVGLGNIGMRVAQVAQAFQMHVSALTSKAQAQLPTGISKADLTQLLATSDIITLHCPLTDATKEMINANTLALMPPSAILINTGRGPLVNEHDVARALHSGQLAAYGADVMVQEPPQIDNPLLTAPNAFLTPHVAWATVEARQRLMQIAVANVKAFLEGSPVNVVN
ncbi:MAG: D-2-hydroxyacid dehydrogenase [Bacteroidaceae bacterium]|nr:D-2-hydroxyacid dehydrogenase [Bacteroidaceae bacterium]